MTRSPRHLARAVLGAALVAALGFGAAEAFAAPAGAPEAARICPTHCEDITDCKCVSSQCVCY